MVFERIKTKELIFLALMAVAWFTLDFIIGQWINAVTGLYMIGFLAAIVSGFFGVMLVKIRPRFWTFTLTLLIWGLLALPTASAGPVGFWPKVLIEVFVGFVADCGFYIMRYKNWSICVGFYIIVLLLYGLSIGSMVLLGVPEADKILKMLPMIILGFWIIGTIGLWLGFYTWRKIKNKPFVRQLQN
jgi:hypothetical protein